MRRCISEYPSLLAMRTSVNCKMFRMKHTIFFAPRPSKFGRPACTERDHIQTRMNRKGASTKKMDTIADLFRAMTTLCRWTRCNIARSRFPRRFFSVVRFSRSERILSEVKWLEVHCVRARDCRRCARDSTRELASVCRQLLLREARELCVDLSDGSEGRTSCSVCIERSPVKASSRLSIGFAISLGGSRVPSSCSPSAGVSGVSSSARAASIGRARTDFEASPPVLAAPSLRHRGPEEEVPGVCAPNEAEDWIEALTVWLASLLLLLRIEGTMLQLDHPCLDSTSDALTGASNPSDRSE
mmetsp:Transcript_62940/g.119646  ORF Transcript_62940/g.119646 Transcript_62940/m.119646 type:complete len:300 (+) Transcript_62940:32-931(+)